MSFQEIGKIANGLMQSGLLLYALILLKRKEHKMVKEVFWFGTLVHIVNFILALSNHSLIFIVYIIFMAYSFYVFTYKPANPK
jgi:hypothetical protein